MNYFHCQDQHNSLPSWLGRYSAIEKPIFKLIQFRVRKETIIFNYRAFFLSLVSPVNKTQLFSMVFMSAEGRLWEAVSPVESLPGIF